MSPPLVRCVLLGVSRTVLRFPRDASTGLELHDVVDHLVVATERGEKHSHHERVANAGDARRVTAAEHPGAVDLLMPAGRRQKVEDDVRRGRDTPGRGHDLLNVVTHACWTICATETHRPGGPDSPRR